VDSALRETWSLGRCAARLHPGVSFDRFTGVVEEEADRARARRAIVVAARRARVIAIVMRRRSRAGERRDQGKRTDARDFLAPIYSWFTEGLDTPVLQEARALVDELA
jgi:hypothetical protein